MQDFQQNHKRIEAKELRCQERKDLSREIPLKTPYLMYIEPTNCCNFRCDFCPTGDDEVLKQVGRPSGFMKMELFRQIVDQMALFPDRFKLVSLYKDGEPLLHPEFPEMVRYLKQAGVTDRIWTKTNGSRLEPVLNRQLIEAGLDRICISVEAVTSEGYWRISHARIDYDRFVENVRDLYEHRGECKIYIKIADYGLSTDEIDRFYADFEPIGDQVAVEKLMGWSASSIKDFTMGTHPDTYDGLPFTPKDVCPYPFYVMSINYNGSVSLCGNDWSHGTVVGDVNSESLQTIWTGDALFEFRRMLLEGRRHCNRACGDCYYLQIVPDNIDNKREMILERLIRQRQRS